MEAPKSQKPKKLAGVREMEDLSEWTSQPLYLDLLMADIGSVDEQKDNQTMSRECDLFASINGEPIDS